MRFKKIKKDEDLKTFVKTFARKIHYEVPFSFFRGEENWIMIEKGKTIGGFSIVYKKKLRSLEQIPDKNKEVVEHYDGITSYLFKSPFGSTWVRKAEVAELTAYWMNKGSVLFPLFYALRAYLHPAKFFVYSYPISQKGLGRYYKAGNPVILYQGIPKKLPGHAQDMEPESVEMVTSKGVFKIAWGAAKRNLNKYKVWNTFKRIIRH